SPQQLKCPSWEPAFKCFATWVCQNLNTHSFNAHRRPPKGKELDISKIQANGGHLVYTSEQYNKANAKNPCSEGVYWHRWIIGMAYRSPDFCVGGYIMKNVIICLEMVQQIIHLFFIVIVLLPVGND